MVGIPLPMYSYGGTSFVTFMILFGILENLLAFRLISCIITFLVSSADAIKALSDAETVPDIALSKGLEFSKTASAIRYKWEPTEN